MNFKITKFSPPAVKSPISAIPSNKPPPLFSDPRKQGGAYLVMAQNPKKNRAFGAILLPFFMNFSYILHVFDTRNNRFSSCVSKFSRLRRTFLFKYIFLQAFCACAESAVHVVIDFSMPKNQMSPNCFKIGGFAKNHVIDFRFQGFLLTPNELRDRPI